MRSWLAIPLLVLAGCYSSRFEVTQTYYDPDLKLVITNSARITSFGLLARRSFDEMEIASKTKLIGVKSAISSSDPEAVRAMVEALKKR